ncbi:HNH endonuclease signature motif containing protein [Mariniluteicoccus flavus]
MTSGEVIDTREALVRAAAALDALSEDRACLGDGARLELVDLSRQVARRVSALAVVLVAEADAAKSCETATGTPLATYLMTDPSVSKSEAMGAVYTGRELAESQAVREAALAGDLPVDRAKVVLKAVRQLPDGLSESERAAAEADLVAHAADVTGTTVAKAVRDCLGRVAPSQIPSAETEQQRLEAQRKRAYARRHLRLLDDGDGGLDIRGNLPALEAAPLVSMINGLVAAGRREQRESRDRLDPLHDVTHEQRSADALIRLVAQASGAVAGPAGPHLSVMAAGSGSVGSGSTDPGSAGATAAGSPPAGLAAAGADPSGPGAAGSVAPGVSESGYAVGVRARVLVTMSLEALTAGAEQAGLLTDGTEISAGDLRRLCCEADIIPIVLGGDSEILDVGRTQRLVTPAMRRALTLRDRGCVFPGCKVPDHRCEAHHIIPWWAGGVTALHNLVLLCPHHHALVEPLRLHRASRPDRWEIEMDPGGMPVVIPPTRVDKHRRPITRAPTQKAAG